MYPHYYRRVIIDTMKFHADNDTELEAALADAPSGARKVVQYYLIHRRPDGSDGEEEVVREMAG